MQWRRIQREKNVRKHDGSTLINDHRHVQDLSPPHHLAWCPGENWVTEEENPGVHPSLTITYYYYYYYYYCKNYCYCYYYYQYYYFSCYYLPHHHIPHSVSAPCVALDVEWSWGQLDGEGGAQLGLVGSAVLEQRQVWRVEEVQMEGIRCKVGGEGACEEVFKVKKLTQVCFRQAFEFQKKMNMSQTGRKGRGNQK